MDLSFRLLAVPLVAACLGVMPSAASAVDLSVLGESELAVTAVPGRDTASTYLSLLNSGKTPIPIAISFEASSNASVHVTDVLPSEVPAGEAVRVQIKLAGLKKLTETVEGVVVISGGSLPVSRSAKITPAIQPSAPWTSMIIIGCFAAMAILGVCVVGKANRDKHLWYLARRAPGPKWSFESWATTATAVGAILGTVSSATTLPAVPRQIDQDTFVRLNLLFGALVLVGPFLFQAVRKPESSPANQEEGLWGYNWSLLIACCITCGAVLGEIATLALLAWEIVGGDTWGTVAVLILAAIWALAAYYFAITAWALAMNDWTVPVHLDPTQHVGVPIVSHVALLSDAHLVSESLAFDRSFSESRPIVARSLARVPGERRSWKLP